MKYKFVGGNEGKKRAQEGETFKFVGSSGTSKRAETKKLRQDLGACLVDMAHEWEEHPVDLAEAKETVLACVEQAELEGGKPEEWHRMKFIINQIEELEDLVKYMYNYMLRASGLSVNRIIGRRD